MMINRHAGILWGTEGSPYSSPKSSSRWVPPLASCSSNSAISEGLIECTKRLYPMYPVCWQKLGCGFEVPYRYKKVIFKKKGVYGLRLSKYILSSAPPGKTCEQWETMTQAKGEDHVGRQVLALEDATQRTGWSDG